MNGIVRAFLEELGGLVLLGGQTLRQLFRRPFERDLWLEQLFQLGVRSLTITNVTLLFTGMVLALQSAWLLSQYLLARGKPNGAARAQQRDVAIRYLAHWRRQFGPRLVFAAGFAHLAMRPRTTAPFSWEPSRRTRSTCTVSAPTGTVRIEAPIPGRNLVGIELPNRSAEFVSLRKIMECQEMQGAKSKLEVALGLDVSGKPIIADISKMPHILIAGQTGSGKSVCINAFLSSLL